jgi:hypothetical protein
LLDTLKDVRKKIHEGSMSNKELIECRCWVKIHRV